MAQSFVSPRSCIVTVALFCSAFDLTAAFTGSQYRLDSEFSGENFFDGWDFYTGRDPTGGLVTYYSRQSSQLGGLIKAPADGPTYIGANSVDTIPYDDAKKAVIGAGRPSVRIATQQSWTHGLFIGDFKHIPVGICGTWPAFWTLGPMWPYTGEIDILEGVNLNQENIMSLHTSSTCKITGNASVMTGLLENTDCAYYPDYNVGCGVQDASSDSYGTFNSVGGGVYAMQWTSEYIRIWQWSRSKIPADVNNKTPDPSTWGLPSAQLGVGNCTIDDHFQQHKIIFDNTFCGSYAGVPSIWNSNDGNSCAAKTGVDTCDEYVAKNPEVFKDAYWEVNYVRVYQLADPDDSSTPTSYIASEQPPNTATQSYNVPPTIATPSLTPGALCPKYNYSIVSDGTYQYEIACDMDPPGPDIIGDPYPGFTANSMEDCLKGCSYLNTNNGSNSCGSVSYGVDIKHCYFKRYIDQQPNYRPGYNEIRLIYYGYPQVTDNPASQATTTSDYVAISVTAQTYKPSTSTTSTSQRTTTTTSYTTVGIPALGNTTTSDSSPGMYSTSMTSMTSGPDASTTSKTMTSGSTATSSATPIIGGVDSTFYITFSVSTQQRRAKRATSYLAFSTTTGDSIIVDDRSLATLFHRDADDNLVTSDNLYVQFDNSTDPPKLETTATKPAMPVQLNVAEDGTISIPGVNGFCSKTNGDLLVLPDGGTVVPADCSTVSPEAVVISNGATGGTSSTTSSALTTTTYSSIATSGFTSTSTTTSATPSVSLVNDFVYAGCFGFNSALTGISQTADNENMSVEKCTATCHDQGAYYAGLHEQICLCGTREDIYSSLLRYPDNSCNIPCPGNKAEMCGGNVGFQGADSATTTAGAAKHRRQAILGLVSLYNNTDLLGVGSGAGGKSGTGTTSTTSGSNGMSTTTSSVSLPGGTLASTKTPTGGIPTSFDSNSVLYSPTATNTLTVISTTYRDICPVCPPESSGMTQIATTITVPHCGCTASYDADMGSVVPVASPAIPMTRTVKHCGCTEGTSVTVTVPETSAISVLVAQASAVASASAIATASAGANAPANTAGRVGVDDAAVEQAASDAMNDEDDNNIDNENDVYDEDMDDMDDTNDSVAPANNAASMEASQSASIVAPAAARPVASGNATLPGIGGLIGANSGNGSLPSPAAPAGPIASYTGNDGNLDVRFSWVMLLMCLVVGALLTGDRV